MKDGKLFSGVDATLVIAALRRLELHEEVSFEEDLLERIAGAPLLLALAARIQAVVPNPAPGADRTLVLTLPATPPPDCEACGNTGWSRSASGRCSCPRGRR